ncbi:MAG: ATP-binding protein, partial [Candidatus Woesearchaeota archaeon]
NTHALVAGSTGSGKSVSSSIIAEEALNNKIPVVVFDPTSQWTGFLSALRDKNIFKVYSKFGLSPEDARSYKGLIFTPKDKNFEINFEEYLNPGEITVFNLAHLSTQDYDDVTEKIINSIFRKGWEESPDLRLLCVFDEVHRLLDSSCEGKGYAALTKGAREFRKWGIGLLMASQVSSDFKEAIGGNVLTEVQLNTKNLDDIKKAQQKYGIDYGRRIARQGLGVAMVQNPRYNNGKPWFINFRPPLHNPHKLSDEELDLYNNYTDKLKLIKLELKELKEKGQDVTDFELDYSLANNKLKEGKFKMSEIYIQGLLERLNIKVE